MLCDDHIMQLTVEYRRGRSMVCLTWAQMELNFVRIGFFRHLMIEAIIEIPKGFPLLETLELEDLSWVKGA